MESKAVRIGLIGCGRVAENHVQAIAKCPDAVLVAATGGSHAADFCDKHNIQLLTPEKLCDSPDVDAVLVLTPPQFHYENTIRALNRGKHVLVEKPVSFNLHEIEDMKKAAKESHAVCMPGHSYLYLPELARMKQVAASKGIGEPTYLYISEAYYMPPELFGKYTGPETDVLCHQLYLSLAYLGVPAQLAAFGSAFDKSVIETGGPQVILNMKYKSGALAQVVVSWAGEDHTSDPWTFKVKMLGSGGGMHFSRRDYVQNVGVTYEQAFYQEMFDQQMYHFVQHCIFGGKQPLSTLDDAAWVCKLHNMVLTSMKNNTVIDVDDVANTVRN